ncbi:MAG: alanyl-tRNA editing protein, partial [Candidatus Bathyarchaeia archaeon]
MAETRKLFNDDPYKTSFKGTVVRVDGSVVELDQTAFYPEGGGQVGDTGVIGGVRVVDTRKDHGIIRHILDSPPAFGVGDEVEGEVDWDRRYLIMKLHSAAHIMEHFLWQSIGMMERVGSRVDEKKDRADYAYEGRTNENVAVSDMTANADTSADFT